MTVVNHHMSTVHSIIQFGSSTAVVANCLLVFLIARHSRPEFGHYKYLMMLFATFNIIYLIVHLSLMPGLHVVGNAFVFYVAKYSPLSGYVSQTVGQYLILYWVVLYDKQLVLIVFHFLYRYVVVCRPELIPTFKKRPVILLMAVYVVIDLSIWTGFLGVSFESESSKTNVMHDQQKNVQPYMKEALAYYYDLDANTAPIWGVLFKYNDTNSIERYRPFNLLATTMVWFTVNIHRSITSSRMSERTRRLQMDLLNALIAQTACPLLMEGIPCMFTHFTSFNAIPIGVWCNYVVVMVALYPLMDAITMIYFIRDYRRVALSIFHCRRITKTNRIMSNPKEVPGSNLTASTQNESKK